LATPPDSLFFRRRRFFLSRHSERSAAAQRREERNLCFNSGLSIGAPPLLSGEVSDDKRNSAVGGDKQRREKQRFLAALGNCKCQSIRKQKFAGTSAQSKKNIVIPAKAGIAVSSRRSRANWAASPQR
jgi:hypothetical protein